MRLRGLIEMQSYSIKPVGVVRSVYREASLVLEDQDLRLNEEVLTRTKTGKESVAELVIEKEYEPCLDGIEGFSHIVVLYWAHKTDTQKAKMAKKVHPAGKKEYPPVGIFATRSPARPNPICSTTVKLLGRKQNVLKVKGLDALDGSPIIDIKFHHPSYDAPPNVEWPDWMNKLITFFRQKLK